MDIKKRLFLSSPSTLIVCKLNRSHVPWINITSPLHAAVNRARCKLRATHTGPAATMPGFRHTSIPKIGVPENCTKCLANLCYVRWFIAAGYAIQTFASSCPSRCTSLERSKESAGFQRNLDTWLNELAFHDEKESFCCSDSVQQPLTQPRAARDDADSLDERNEQERGFQLQNIEEAFSVRCRAAPTLCAPGSSTEPMSSRELSPFGILPKYMWHFTFQVDGAAPMGFCPNPLQGMPSRRLTQHSATRLSKEALLLERSKMSSA